MFWSADNECYKLLHPNKVTLYSAVSKVQSVCCSKMKLARKASYKNKFVELNEGKKKEKCVSTGGITLTYCSLVYVLRYYININGDIMTQYIDCGRCPTSEYRMNRVSPFGVLYGSIC